VKNLPEAEGIPLKVTVIDGIRREIFCDVDELIDCDEYECAIEIFDLYIRPILPFPITRYSVSNISVVRGGKIFVYNVDDRRICLAIHRIDMDPDTLCR